MKKPRVNCSRRQVLRWGAAVTAAVCTRRVASAAFPSGPQALSAAALPTFRPTLLNQVNYAQVDLDPGPAQEQFEQCRQVLLNLSDDGLLRPFRFREGLPTPGDELGGWYSTDGFAAACPFGQWISALSRMYAVTRDPATYAKIDRMIRGYAATLEPIGRFYQNYAFPGYMYDKLSIGLTDAHVFAHHPAAFDVLAQTTDIVLPYLPPKAMPHQETPILAGENFTRHVWDETYTMPENSFLAWQRTGKSALPRSARRFLFDEYFDPLARGENALPGRHAYSHVNALGSAAMAWLALSDEKYLHAATNAFDFVQQQSFATGGWGPREHFIEPGSGALGESLNTAHNSFETPCGAYAHFKLARYLLRITADPRYGDSMEQVFFNTVLGARPLELDGSSFYYSDYTFKAQAHLQSLQVAVLLGHAAANRCRLPHQRLLPQRARRLCESLSALHSALECTRRAVHLAAKNRVSLRQPHPPRRYGLLARRVLGFPAHSRVGPGRVAYRERHARFASA